MAQLTGKYEEIYNTLLSSDISQFQNLQVFDERGILIAHNRVYYEFKNWITDYPLTSFRLLNTPGQANIDAAYYAIDFTEGIVTFDPSWKSLAFADSVYGKYSFRYFTNADIKAFLDQTNYEMNLLKSTWSYAIGDIPNEWMYILSLGAYTKALRKIAFDQIIWKNRFIFGDGTLSMQAQVQSAYERANADFVYLRDILRRRREDLKPLIVMDYNVSTARIPASMGDLRFVGRYI